MFKKLTALLLVVLLLLTGCGTVDIMDDTVNDLVQDYTNHTKPGTTLPAVGDMLDRILDDYVSGLKIPDRSQIQHNTVDPAKPGNTFQNVNNNCNSIDEMKQCILQALSNTEKSVTFYINPSLFSRDVLYNVVFNQLCEEYMLETMGMQKYQYSTMQADANRLAVSIEFFYFENKYSLNDVKTMKQQSLEKAKEIIRTLGLEGKSTYDQVYLVNKYLCDNCVYPKTEPYSAESHSIYGALIEKSAVCEGYARSAQLIFSLLNINSYFVVGDTPAGGHAWNLVYVDGAFYQLDITWNDAEYQPNAYFLVTDEYMSKSRTWDTTRYPASSKTPYK